MPEVLARLESGLDRLGQALMAWWVWPAFLALVGAAALAAALVVSPGEAEQTLLFGQPWAGPCAFREAHGVPCMHCGMTRSWVYSARGQLLRGLAYNPAGATAFLWLVGFGILGAVRLVTRRRELLAVPYPVVGAVGALWFFGLYLGIWAARLAGFLPLP